MILKYDAVSAETIIASSIEATSADDVTSFCSFRTRTSTTLVPNNKTVVVDNSGPNNVCDAPALSGEIAYIDSIIIGNRDTISRTITILFSKSTTFVLLWSGVLLTGEKLVWTEAAGWIVYTANGIIKESQPAAGSNTQIQYNSNGAFGAESGFTWDTSSNELGLNDPDSYIQLTDHTSDPSTPAAGKLRIWSKSVSGRSMLKQMGPGGIDTVLQNAIFQNNIVQWYPAAAAGVYQGTSGSNLGTPVIVLPTVTNLATMMRRSVFPSVVTTLNQQVGIRTEAMFFRGNAANLGGFFFVCRFMFATWTAGDRLFVGLTSGSTAVVTVQPSSLLNMLGFGIDAADTAITFMHNDGAGTCTKDTIAGQPSLATNQGYIAYIFCKPNDSTVYYRLDNVNLQTTIIDTSASSDLPVNTTALTAQCIMGNAANIVAGNASIGINAMYVETDV